MADQDQIFLKKEGDGWFKRNLSALGNSFDIPLYLIEQYNLKPKKVLEIGCSNGWRLAKIGDKYGAECFGVEPSLKAIEDGRRKYPKIKFKRGLASLLPFKEKFDLVVINFVLHWVDRGSLLKAIAEIDRVLSKNSFLIIGDFLPDYPIRNRYHHLLKQKVYTYKQDYAEIFISSRLYELVAKITFNHSNKAGFSLAKSQDQCAGCLLRKMPDRLYFLNSKFKK